MTSLNITFSGPDNTAEIISLLIHDASLPFPFRLPYSNHILIAALMTLTLFSGSYFRMVIIKYLLETSTKIGPINLLVWMDQTNGVFLAVNIVGRIAAFLVPFPLSKITGDAFCRWSPLPGE